jgi:hypothetical protein
LAVEDGKDFDAHFLKIGKKTTTKKEATNTGEGHTYSRDIDTEAKDPTQFAGLVAGRHPKKIKGKILVKDILTLLKLIPIKRCRSLSGLQVYYNKIKINY